jgi:hypothetical protein
MSVFLSALVEGEPVFREQSFQLFQVGIESGVDAGVNGVGDRIEELGGVCGKWCVEKH